MTMEDIAANGHGLVDSMIGEKYYEMLKDIVLHLEDVKNIDEAFGGSILTNKKLRYGI